MRRAGQADKTEQSVVHRFIRRKGLCDRRREQHEVMALPALGVKLPADAGPEVLAVVFLSHPVCFRLHLHHGASVPGHSNHGMVPWTPARPPHPDRRIETIRGSAARARRANSLSEPSQRGGDEGHNFDETPGCDSSNASECCSVLFAACTAPGRCRRDGGGATGSGSAAMRCTGKWHELRV